MFEGNTRFRPEPYTDADVAGIEDENREEAFDARMEAVANREVADHAMLSHPDLGRRLARVADLYDEIAGLLDGEEATDAS